MDRVIVGEGDEGEDLQYLCAVAISGCNLTVRRKAKNVKMQP